MKKIGLFILTMICVIMIGCGSKESTVSTTTVTKTPEVKKIVEPGLLAYNNQKVHDLHLFDNKPTVYVGSLITQKLAITNRSDYEIIKLDFIPKAYTLYNENMPEKEKQILDNILVQAGLNIDTKIPKGVTIKAKANFFLTLNHNVQDAGVQKRLLNSMRIKDYNSLKVTEDSQLSIEKKLSNEKDMKVLKNIKTYSYDIKVTYSNGQVQTISKKINFTSAHNIKTLNTIYKVNGETVNYSEIEKEIIFNIHFDGETEELKWTEE